MTTNRWGQARREVQALEGEIKTRLKGGETLRQIWVALRAEGRLDVSLSQFYKNINGITGTAPKAVPTITHVRTPRAVVKAEVALEPSRSTDTSFGSFVFNPSTTPVDLDLAEDESEAVTRELEYVDQSRSSGEGRRR